MQIVTTLGGVTLDIPETRVTNVNAGIEQRETNPVKVSGPATLVIKSAIPSFATLNITRVGIASGPAVIPLERGTVWQVNLEASTDLVNWTAVAPGDYPAASPQRFFRTRMVKRA